MTERRVPTPPSDNGATRVPGEATFERGELTRLWVLTGGIGSGKSTIRNELEELGAMCLDADELAHEAYQTGGPAFDAVVERWPEVLVDGAIDRARLADIVFSQPDQLFELEEIVHPAVGGLLADRAARARDGDVVVEISVPKDLLGVGPEHTIVADLPDVERFERLKERGMEVGDIARRMAAQPTREEWMQRGHHVISTSGSREQVASRVRSWWDGRPT